MNYFFAAYLIIWIVLFIYIFRMFLIQKKLNYEINNLKQIVEKKI